MRPENRQGCAHLHDQILTTDPDSVIERQTRARRSRVRSTASQLRDNLRTSTFRVTLLVCARAVFAAWVQSNQSGRLAQLGERRVRNAEVASSILAPSTRHS